jgi:hypothetical protein
MLRGLHLTTLLFDRVFDEFSYPKWRGSFHPVYRDDIHTYLFDLGDCYAVATSRLWSRRGR